MQTKLWNKDFTLVVLGQIISLFGNAILRFALPLYILETSKSPALFGQVSAMAFLPMIILSPIGGMIADRVSKQRIMVALDFATCLLILGYIMISGFTSSVALVIAVLMMLFSIQGTYTPAVQSSIPLLVEPDRLVAANAVVNMVTSLSGMIGPVMGGLLYSEFGLSPVLKVSCVCFFLSAVMELFIKIAHTKQKAPDSIWHMVKSDIGDSIRFIAHEKPILAKSIVIVFSFNVVMGAMIIIGLPVLITQTLGLSSKLYGITQGVMGAGGIIGGLSAGLLGKGLTIQKMHILLLCCSLSNIPMILVLFFGLPSLVSYAVITSMCFFAMMTATLFQIQMFVFIQTLTPSAITGKVISCLVAVALCAQPVGQLLFGNLFELLPDRTWMIVLGATLLSGTVALYSKRHFGRIKDEDLRQ